MELIYYLIGINIVAFFTYGLDKRKAIKTKRRIRESVLLLFALFGGGIGSFLGMQFFHHKTHKLKFKVGVPLLTIISVLIYLIIVHLTTGL